MSAPLVAGFIPLVDAAPLVIAREIGFAEEEGLALELRPAASWATLRDRVSLGQVEAAHMLAPVPVAMALGLGGGGARLDVLQVLSVNGNAIGVSTALADIMREAGHPFDFADPVAAGQALLAAKPEGLRIGVPVPFSGHAELLYHWLGALGADVPLRTKRGTGGPAWPKWRRVSAMAGHHGLPRLHLKVWGCPPRS